ncbi:hypothetical protein [Mucilaginibacter sp.]
MAVQYPIAWHTIDNCLVDVDEAKRGVADYRCPDPDCEKPLIFKRNYKGTKYFTHKVAATCTGETWLHSTAIIIIQENSYIMINGTNCNYTNVRTKQPIGKRIPDAIIDTDKYLDLLIEVVVKSDLTKEKLADLDAHNILRIDLENLKINFKNLNKEKLTNMVLYDTGRISLIPACTYTATPAQTTDELEDYSWIVLLAIPILTYFGLKYYNGHSTEYNQKRTKKLVNHIRRKQYW